MLYIHINDVVFLYRYVLTPYQNSSAVRIHAESAHLNMEYTANLINKNVYFGKGKEITLKDIKEFNDNEPCKACELLNTVLQDHTNSPYDKSDQYKTGQYWGADLGVAPISIPGYDGSLYILLFVCLVTRYCKIYFLERKRNNVCDG